MKWAAKRIMYLLLFSGVIFIPYAIMHSGSTNSDAVHPDQVGVWEWVTNWVGDTSDSITNFFRADDPSSQIDLITEDRMLSANPTGNTPHLDGGTIEKLRDVFNFSITPDWVTQRWARVSTEIHSDSLQGYRVPIVTGEQLDDLAGSLTYYFDRNHHVQRIEFIGYTGDTTRIISILQKQHHLTKRPTTLEGLYIKSQNRRPVSLLRITRPTVVNAATAYSQFEVKFELNRPAIGAQLSKRFQQILAADQALKKA